ncbi:MAG: hypothetical protein PHX83_12295 [Acidobacteriia bacterium]|nr:hypothetical protein [Terriglobia bacterium]
MASLYDIIGNISLFPIPEDRQTILWVWNDERSRLDKKWVEGLIQISKWCPDLGIRTAHLERDPVKGAHKDGMPGLNLIWVHVGSGFRIEESRVEATPGDVILFDRQRGHRVDAETPYIRTVITTIGPESEQKHPRFLKNGIFYEDFKPRLVELGL